MPRWGPFLAVIAVLTVLLLALARQSQQLIREHADAADAPREQGGAGSADGAVDTPPADGTAATAGDDTRPADSLAEDTAATPGDDARAPDTPTAGPTAGPADGDSAGSDPRTPFELERAGGDAGRGGPQLTSRVLLANVAGTQALVAVLVLVAVWYFSIPAAALGVTGDPLASSPPGVAVGIAFGVVLWLANELSTTVADAVGAAYDETVRELLSPDSGRGWAALFLVVLPLIAVSEELLFRAALIGVPAAGFDVSPWLLAVVASLAFALGHGAQGRVGIVVTGLLGFALAGGYILTGSLLVVVVAHYVINALEFLVHELLGIDTILPVVVSASSRLASD